jgi:glycosyltransferase involved in cell wall biosynthesis
MRIHHIQGLFAPEHGGPTYALRNYCLGQAGLGHEVSAWVLRGMPNTSGVQPMPAPIITHVFPAGVPGVLGRSGTLRRHLADSQTPDIYHLHGTWLRAMYYGALEARRRRVPYLVEMMGMYEPYGLKVKWARKRLARLWFQDAILREANCLHVCSMQEAENLRRLDFKQPIAVIPVGVEVPAVSRDEPAYACPWPQIQGRRFILYLSRVHEKKGLEMLFKAWAALAPSFPDHLLVVCGSGASGYEDQCRRALSDLGIIGRSLWVGPVSEEEKRWAYTQASFYVLPSFSENYGNTIAESLAHATPVVVTDATPWAEVTRVGCGWVVPPRTEPLEQAIREALNTSKAELRSMGDRGHHWARADFSLPSVIRKIDEAYRWLCGRTPRPEFVIL